MYKKTLEIFSAKSNLAILSVAHAASRMPVAKKAIWATRLNYVYGDMGGQRAVSFPDIASRSDQKDWQNTLDQSDLIIGLEVFYAVTCLLIASAALEESPALFVTQFFAGGDEKTRRKMTELLDGRNFEQFGINGFRNTLDCDWLPDALSHEDLESLAQSLLCLSSLWDGDRFLIEGIDPLQKIHKIILPKNLMHITGQFYSPEWLAELLIEDVGFSGEGRLIDPFCGSGVFLLSALNKSLSRGVPMREALDGLLGIDLNPSACIAARCNLVIQISKHNKNLTEPVSLNILNADSIAPSITRGLASSRTEAECADQISIGGSMIPLTDRVLSDLGRYTDALTGYGLRLENWSLDRSIEVSDLAETSTRDRRITEQLFLFNIKPAEFLLTNPPWVGWEYMSRPYRTEIQPAWDAYDLFNAKGLNAAFLKEDLSTLAMVSAWDLYLGTSGKSAAVLKPSTMRADLTGRGIRRLSLHENSSPLKLEKVREFEKMKVFSDAQTDTCSWVVQKDAVTIFPVPVAVWTPQQKRWAPDSCESMNSVKSCIKESTFALQRTEPDDHGSRWMIAKDKQLADFTNIRGSNSHKPRMGVFTGGANAVFYLEHIKKEVGSSNISTWSNIVHRAKRLAPKRVIDLEDSIVKSVARGRDISMWVCDPEVHMLFPHTSETKMYPMAEKQLTEDFPLAWQYLEESADILRSRKGFAGWEKKIHLDFFYTLQRIGEYTFAPFKVCWKYVSSEFTVCVLGGQPLEQELIPNDKVMFIPFENADAAFYVGGMLSSSMVRQYVHSCMSSRQISTSIIKNIRIPEFDATDGRQRQISDLCRDGHQHARDGRFSEVKKTREELDKKVGNYYRASKDSSAA